MSDVELPAAPTVGPHGTFDDERTAELCDLVGLDVPRYRQADVAALTGVDHERSVKWWRALGFPEVPPDVAAFNDLDVRMVRRIAALSGAGLADDNGIHRLARLLGASFSRIAEAQVDFVAELLASLPGADPAATSRERITALVEASDESVLGLLEEPLVYVWRRHLLAAFGRRIGIEEPATATAAVGFADLSGFTKLSQRVPSERLGELIDTFETMAIDAVASHRGRAVKLIGDEIMYTAESMSTAVDIGLDIADRLAEVPDMPKIHGGVAFGPVVAVGGDVFGPAVNLAARLTAAARPGTIVIPRDGASGLVGRGDLMLVPVRRTLHLRGIGDTRVTVVRRRVAPAPSS